VKVSIGKTRFDDLELQVFEDELKHLDRDEYEKAPELKFRSITRKHSLCHMDCIEVRKGTKVNASTVDVASVPGLVSSLLTLNLMSLAEASEARKARLTALRKRKAGERIDEEGCVSSSSLTIVTKLLDILEMQNLS
jgi:hypothetical protein